LDDRAWWSGGAFFSCTGCGRCCRGEPGAIFFTPEEGERVRKFLGLDEAKFKRDCVTLAWGRPSFRERRNGDCVFYDALSAKCSIYHIRPLQCALFPFWPSVMESREVWDKEALRCPGMNSGQFHTAEEIKGALTLDPFGGL
jgi:Fe-S-cluster containining protein